MTPTFEGGTQLPDSKAANTEVLTEGEFKEEHRDAGEEQRYEVWY